MRIARTLRQLLRREHGRRRASVLLLVWSLQVLLPILHVHEAAEHFVAAGEAPPTEPGSWLHDCQSDGPCPDPSHHHPGPQDPHDSDGCALCASFFSSAVEAPEQVLPAAVTARLSATSPSFLVVRRDDWVVVLARGPPSWVSSAPTRS